MSFLYENFVPQKETRERYRKLANLCSFKGLKTVCSVWREYLPGGFIMYKL